MKKPVKKMHGGMAEGRPGPKRAKWAKKYNKKWDKAGKISSKDDAKKKKYISKKTDKTLKKTLKKTGQWSKKEGMKGADTNNDGFISHAEAANAKKIVDIIADGKKKHGDRYEKTLGHKIRKSKVDRLRKKMKKMKTKEPAYKSAKGGKVGASVRTYSSGGYVEGE